LRARSAGTVSRLPGDGEGLARLVELSMVKVDMAGTISRSIKRWQKRSRGGMSGA
jgi:hypothetical protein